MECLPGVSRLVLAPLHARAVPTTSKVVLLSSRITDVQDFVARAQRSCTPFVLTTSVPFRELSDKELSLEEADLAKAVIVQRPLNTQAPFGHS